MFRDVVDVIIKMHKYIVKRNVPLPWKPKLFFGQIKMQTSKFYPSNGIGVTIQENGGKR